MSKDFKTTLLTMSDEQQAAFAEIAERTKNVFPDLFHPTSNGSVRPALNYEDFMITLTAVACGFGQGFANAVASTLGNIDPDDYDEYRDGMINHVGLYATNSYRERLDQLLKEFKDVLFDTEQMLIRSKAKAKETRAAKKGALN